MTKKKQGRPTKYTDENFKFAMVAYKFGATDKEVAETIGVTQRTIDNWKIEHDDFFQSLKQCKHYADSEVEKALHKRALGYEKEVLKDNGNIEEKHYPPDTTACIFWLKNRKPNEWRDKQDLGLDEDTLEKLEITVNPRAKEK